MPRWTFTSEAIRTVTCAVAPSSAGATTASITVIRHAWIWTCAGVASINVGAYASPFTDWWHYVAFIDICVTGKSSISFITRTGRAVIVEYSMVTTVVTTNYIIIREKKYSHN